MHSESRQWNSGSQAARDERPARALPASRGPGLKQANLLENVPDSVWPHGNDQKLCLFHRAAKIPLNHHPMLTLQCAQLVGIAIVDDDCAFVAGQAKSGKQGSGDAASAEKDRGLHASSAQA
jgi:hypothetical protein